MSQETAFATQKEIDELTSRSFELRHQDTRQALELCVQARDLSLKIDYQAGYAYSLYLIGLCQHILGAQEGVIGTIQQALSLFQSIGNEYRQAQSYNLLGLIHSRKGSFDDAIAYYEQSLEIRQRIGDKNGEAGSHNNIGIAYMHLAQFSDAFEHLYKSLDVAQSIPSPRAASYAMFNIARIFIEINDLERAREYFVQTLVLNEDTGDHALTSSILAELGKTYALLKEHDNAIQHLERSLHIAQTIGNIHDQGIALLNMGIAYQENGQYTKAEDLFEAAMRVMSNINDRASQSEVLCLQGKNRLAQGMFAEAVAVLHQSLQLAEEIRLISQMWNAHNLLAEVHKTKGDFKKALEHFESYHIIWKNYYSRDSERRIHAIIAQAEIEKARRDAEEHRIRSNALSRALHEAKQAETEKAKTLSQLEMQSRVLEQLTREDGLTGLSNRRWLDIQVNQEFERARRFAHPLTIALLDVDNFKSVNDRFSHLLGDKVLRQVATLLRESCRSVDCVGRYGGEEFMIILVETGLEPARALCNKILKNIRDFPWHTIHPELWQVTASIGICDNSELRSPSEMIAIADKQLYRAKQQGKDQVCNQFSTMM